MAGTMSPHERVPPNQVSVYREMPEVLGTEERESAAIRDFGRWRDRTRMGVILVFALAGLAPAGLGYWLAQEAQFRLNDGIAILYVNVAGLVIAWGAMFAIGAVVARRVVSRRTAARLAALAAGYELPVERLAETARVVEDLS